MAQPAPHTCAPKPTADHENPRRKREVSIQNDIFDVLSVDLRFVDFRFFWVSEKISRKNRKGYKEQLWGSI